MTHHEDLIKWLYECGFEIEAQKATLDEGKYYTVISTHFTGAKKSCDLYAAVVGRLDLHDENSRGFLSRSLQNYRNKSKGDPALLPLVKRLEEALYEAE